jgi:hypothetical protein
MRKVSGLKTLGLALLIPIILSLIVTCSSTSEKFSFSHSTTDEWNALVDKTIPEQDRAARVKKLGLQMIDLTNLMTDEYEKLDASLLKLNENYNTTREDAKKVLGDFLETRKTTFGQYRDVIFAIRSEVSAEEWKKLTDN